MSNSTVEAIPLFCQIIYGSAARNGSVPVCPTVEPFQTTVNGPTTAGFAIFGFLCNLWGLHVFRKQHHPPRIYQYLVCLTLWDCGVLVGAFLLYCLPTLMYGCVVAFGKYVHVYPLVYGLSHCSLVGNVWVIVVFSIDRSFALYRPLVHRVMQSRGRTRTLLQLITLAVILYCLPRFFEIRVGQCDAQPQWNLGAVYIMETAAYRMNSVYINVYKVGGALLFYSVIPFAMQFALTLFMLTHLRRGRAALMFLSASHNRRSDNNDPNEKPYARRMSRHRQSSDGSALMAVLCLKFLLSRLLPVCLDLAESSLTLGGMIRYPIMIKLVTISNFMVILNSATNQFVYVIFGQKLRQDCFNQMRRLAGLKQIKRIGSTTKFHESHNRTPSGASCSRAQTSGRDLHVVNTIKLCKSLPVLRNSSLVIPPQSFCYVEQASSEQQSAIQEGDIVL